MEDDRSYFDDEEPISICDPEGEEFLASSQEDEVPFHIPRD